MALATPLAARIISFCHLNGFLLQGLQCPGSLRLEGTFSQNAGVAQWLERHVANVNVVGSNPITRFLPQKEQNCFGAFTRRRLLGAGIFLLWRIFYPEAILDPSPGGCLNPRCSQ